jgi:DNA-binding protein HU-beta
LVSLEDFAGRPRWAPQVIDRATPGSYDIACWQQQRLGDCLIKLDIINEVVNRTGITKTKAEMAVETVFETMKKALSDGDRIELRGFGIFNVRPRKTGIGRNPRTGAEVAIPPGKAVRFKPGKELQTLQ